MSEPDECQKGHKLQLWCPWCEAEEAEAAYARAKAGAVKPAAEVFARLRGEATGEPTAEDFELVERYASGGKVPTTQFLAALALVLAAAREAEQLRKEVEYASDDLAFLDKIRARLEAAEGALTELKRQADLMAPDLLVTADRLAAAEAALTRLGKYEAVGPGYSVGPDDPVSMELRARIEFARSYFDAAPTEEPHG